MRVVAVGDEKWLDFGYALKVWSMRFANKLMCEGKKRKQSRIVGISLV